MANRTNKIGSFLRSVKLEAKKITWPSRAEVIKSTAIVIVAIIIFAIIIGGIDIFFIQILKLLLG